MSFLEYKEGFRPSISPEDEATYTSLENYRTLFSEYPGQINMSTQLGSLIYRIASDEREPRIWLEIGTWNGLGTTTCILDGFQERGTTDCKLYSLEADPLFFEIAQKNLEAHPMRESLHLTYAKSGDGPFLRPEEIEEQTNRHFELHYDYEKTFWDRAPCFKYPELPEVAILDGGEYTGSMDWMNLPKESLQWIVLDDINCMKNKVVYQEILSMPEWSCITVNTKERNGFAIFRKN
jgi:hypothetical protein